MFEQRAIVQPPKFTRQSGFINKKIFGFLDQTVSGDNLFNGNLLENSITKHGCLNLHDGN